MKLVAFGLLAIAAVTQCSVIPLQTVRTVVPVASTTLVRTPSLDSAVINSERLDGSFRYETVENHAYTPYSTPVVYQSVPTWNVIPQYPVVYGHLPASHVYPVYNYVPQYTPVNAGGSQTPIEVEDPADNASNDLKEETNNDDDTVEIESA